MVSSEEAGGSPPQPAARLQPDDRDRSMRPVLQSTLDELHTDGFTVEEVGTAEVAALRLAQLAADQEMVNRLRRADFTGPAYEMVKAMLAGYGLPVIRAMIRRRQIYQLCADHGRPVQCPDHVREHLARDEDDRLELAAENVARALPFFRKNALLNGNWNAEGGATLTTYFVGGCIRMFPNAFRAWHREFRMGHVLQLYELDPALDHQGRHPLDARYGDDPVDIVMNADTFRRGLASLRKPRLQEAVAAIVLEDVDYKEVARRLGTTEGAVKNMFYEFRKEAARRAKGRQT
jgi:DNA-directed RNA polymerase specialized sigma24 family protein